MKKVDRLEIGCRRLGDGLEVPFLQLEYKYDITVVKKKYSWSKYRSLRDISNDLKISEEAFHF